ncbi:MAG TPA: LrgB family protein [Methylomirabilota bacterium]|nr:LrgB family protein [Methylomirabilota bacterium]
MIGVVTLFSLSVTVAAYALSRLAARRYPSPLTTPVFFSTALILLVLVSSGVQVADYEPAKRILVYLLGPATVSLAVPLYKNRQTLLRHAMPALLGLGVGSLVTLGAAVVLARVLGLPEVIRVSISIKSVTAPIAVELAPIIQGSPSLTAAFVIATGMIGTMLGPWLMTVTGIHDPLSRGLALGAISHGQGTAQAVTEGELQGAAAGIAMSLAAVFTACVAPFVVPILK